MADDRLKRSLYYGWSGVEWSGRVEWWKSGVRLVENWQVKFMEKGIVNLSPIRMAKKYMHV